MKPPRSLFAGLAISIVAVMAPLPATGAQNASESEQGKTVFVRFCVVCHGSDGTGGEAPSLNHPNLDRAPDDDALRSLVANGILNRMPAMSHLTDTELGQVAAYVRSLGRTPSPPSAGNAQAGGQVYQRAGCPACHIVNGLGGSFGPVLTEIGALRGASYLRQAVVDPGAALPVGTLTVPGRALREYLPVRVVTRDGREVRGIRVNEDAVTIQLRDSSNQFHSFRKSDLQQIAKETDASLMPGYKDRLPAADLADLVAYLSSLRGSR